MKRETLKTFLDVHSWTGLGAGIALFVAFYAGAITVFTHEIDEWDSYAVAAETEQDYAHAQALLQRVIASEPVAGETLRLDLSSPEHPGNQVRWFQRLDDGSFERREYRLDGDGSLDTALDSSALAGFIYRLHYTLGLPSQPGLYLLGVICFIYGIALVSGVVIFVPNFFRDLFAVRTGTNKKRFWLDAHNVVGVMSLPWHIMFAWSSAVLAIGIFMIAPFQLLVVDDDLVQMLGPEMGQLAIPEPTGDSAPMLSVAELLAAAQAQMPGLEATQVRYHNVGDSNAVVRITGKTHTDHLEPRARLMLRATDGEVLAMHHPQSASAGTRFYRGLIALHFVSFGGYLAKWVYFILGLAGAFLFYSGNLLWVETRRKRRQSAQPRGGVILARINSGVCIGCIAGISAAFLASRGLASLPNRAELMELTYFAVFFACIAWCFLRPVAAGTRDVLYLSAALATAIPLFDVAFLDASPWGSAMAGRWVLLTVDVLALAGALSCWLMARAVQRRALSGDPNSVWAATAVNPEAGSAAQAQAL